MISDISTLSFRLFLNYFVSSIAAADFDHQCFNAVDWVTRGLSICKVMLIFLLLARYVPNVAKRSI